jgi:3-oxoacyl-[acyl-carrier protein] reductase
VLDDFSGRAGTAIVTGGSGGIGAAVCRRLAQAGSAVAFTYRSRRAEAQSLLSELSAGVLPVSAHQVDLTDAAATEQFVSSVAQDSGGVHTVVHAAGPFVPQAYLSQVTPAMMLAQLTQDPAAFFTLVRAALPALRASRGSVVAVTTAATRRHPARDGLSTGAKGAVEALARAFAVEEGRYGVRVNCVGPGMLTDGMSAVLTGSGSSTSMRSTSPCATSRCACSAIPPTSPRPCASSLRTGPGSSPGRSSMWTEVMPLD